MELIDEFKSFKGLEHLFITDPEKYCAKCDDLILNSVEYKKIINDPEYVQHSCCNITSIDTNIFVHCKTCSGDGYVLFCPKCFLEGNHIGHKAKLISPLSGSCKCGSFKCKKSEICCKKHKLDVQKKNYTEFGGFSNIIESIFSYIVECLPYCVVFDHNLFEIISKYLIRYIKLDDMFLECISKVIIDNRTLKRLVTSTFSIPKETRELYWNFIITLSSNSHFESHVCSYIFSIYLDSIHFINTNTLASIETQSKLDVTNTFKFLEKNIQFLDEHRFAEYKSVIFQDSRKYLNIIVDSFKEIVKFTYTNRIHSELTFLTPYLISFVCIFNALKDKHEEISFILYEIIYFWRKYEYKNFVKRAFGEKQDQNSNLYISALPVLIPLASQPFQKDIVSFFLKIFNQPIEIGNQSICPLEKESIGFPIFIIYPAIIWTVLFHSFPDHNKPKEYLSEVFESPLDEFLFNSSLGQTILFAAAHQAGYGLYVRNTDYVLMHLNCAFHLYYMNQFAYVQFSIGHYSQKDIYIKRLFEIFGMNYSFEDFNQENNIIFATILFVSCLVFDRICIYNDRTSQVHFHVISSLIKKSISQRKLNKILQEYNLLENEEYNKLYTKIYIPSTGKYKLKLKSLFDWHPILPWIPAIEIQSLIATFIQQNTNDECPFPNWTDEPFGMDLKSILVSKSMFALYYRILHNYYNKLTEKTESILLVLHLIQYAHKFYSHNSIRGMPETLIAESFTNLCELIPENFDEMIVTKIKYKNFESVSIVDMLQQLRPVANNTLNILGFCETKTNIDIPVNNDQKEKARKLKESIIMEYHKKQDAIQNEFNEENGKDECPVCHEYKPNQILCYPAMYILTDMPSHINKESNNRKSIQIVICRHLTHASCVNTNPEKNYICPICRCQRNAFIPPLLGEYEKLDPHEIAAMFNWYGQLNGFDPLEVYWDNLIMIEYRFRSRPDCLDFPEIALFIRNFFLCLYHSNQYINICQNYKGKRRNTVLQFFSDTIYQLKPTDNFMQNVINTYNNINTAKEKYVFLRIAYIFEYFALQNGKIENTTIDWDEVLSFNVLCQHFGTHQQEEIYLEPFTVNIPKSFLEFAIEPYNIDYDPRVLICLELISGSLIDFSKKTERKDIKNWVEVFSNEQFCIGLYLILNGKMATAMGVIQKSTNIFKKFRISPYIKHDGDEDIGLCDLEILNLSDEKLDKILDMYLSGEWIFETDDFKI